MDYLTFLLAILHMHKALCEEPFWDTTVQFSDNMNLECVYPSMGFISQMDWTKINGTQKETIAVYNPFYGVAVMDPYSSRVYFPNTTEKPSDLSLSFYNATEDDAGHYSCSCHIFPDGVWQKRIKVVQSDSFDIATPSNSSIITEPGQNVTLTYQLQKNWPVEQVTWEKVQPHQIDILASCNLSQGRSYSSKSLRHTWSNCSQGSTKSFLIITDAIATDSGLYRCYFKARTGEEETFVIRLIVNEGQAKKQLIFFITGGIASLLLTILTVVIIILYKRRRRRQASMPVKESRDKQSKVANNYRNPTSTNQSTDEEKEDIYVNYPTFSRRPKLRV